MRRLSLLLFTFICMTVLPNWIRASVDRSSTKVPAPHEKVPAPHEKAPAIHTQVQVKTVIQVGATN